MTDAAARAGVSQSTVSFVLNRVSGIRISDTPRHRRRAATRELGDAAGARLPARREPPTWAV